MKSYQFFKICKRFDKERENTDAAVNEKKKTEKSWILFYNRLFYKSFNVKIIQSFVCFGTSFAAKFLLFDIRMTQEISKGEVGNGK